MDGVEMLQAFCKWKNDTTDKKINENMLLIGLSASNDPQDYQKAFNVGMHYFIPKPLKNDVLNMIVKSLRGNDNIRSALTVLNKDFTIRKKIQIVWNNSIDNLN